MPSSKTFLPCRDDIARHVVGAAAIKLTRFERERVLTKPTENLAAYGYLLRGREFLSHAARDKNDEAAELFQRAIELDPNYAGLCRPRRLAFRSRRWGMDRISAGRARTTRNARAEGPGTRSDDDERLPPACIYQHVQAAL